MGAGAAYSTPSDMVRYLAALMHEGANEYGSVLKPATLASMFEAQYQPHPRIPGMGLAFWRRNANSHRLVEHIGVMPGFDSKILVAPDDDLGVMAFANGTHGGTGWISVELSTLVNRLLGVSDEVIRTDVPQRPEIWGDLCGRYYLPGPLTDVRLRAFLGAGVEVFVRRGQLFIRMLSQSRLFTRGFPCIQTTRRTRTRSGSTSPISESAPWLSCSTPNLKENRWRSLRADATIGLQAS